MSGDSGDFIGESRNCPFWIEKCKWSYDDDLTNSRFDIYSYLILCFKVSDPQALNKIPQHFRKLFSQNTSRCNPPKIASVVD